MKLQLDWNYNLSQLDNTKYYDNILEVLLNNTCIIK